MVGITGLFIAPDPLSMPSKTDLSFLPKWPGNRYIFLMLWNLCDRRLSPCAMQENGVKTRHSFNPISNIGFWLAHLWDLSQLTHYGKIFHAFAIKVHLSN